MNKSPVNTDTCRTYNGRTFTPFEMATAERGSDAWLAAVHGTEALFLDELEATGRDFLLARAASMREDYERAARCACVYAPDDDAPVERHDDGTPKVRPRWVLALEAGLMGVIVVLVVLLAARWAMA